MARAEGAGQIVRSRAARPAAVGPNRADPGRAGLLRLMAVMATGSVLVLAGCQSTRPAPVEVRAQGGTAPLGRPAPDNTVTIEPGALPPAAGSGSGQLGPSGRPVRTEPYGLKRAYGEPPRPRSGEVGGSGPSTGGLTGAGTAGGGAAGGGRPGAGASGQAPLAIASPVTGAEAPPVPAPTVLPPASGLEGRPGAAAAPAGAGQASGTGAAPAVTPPTVATAPATSPATRPPGPAQASGSGSLGGVRFGWPLKGSVLQDFSQTSERGLSLGARPKTAVAAAADGKVIFSGAGPREYGNLIIVKHANDLLSVYANNSSLAVKEGEDVKRGQKIAEAGSVASRPQLHFEIRQQGKPIDPLTVLPAL